MAENIVYLDHAATTPLHPEALGIMLPFFGNHFWNPNSAYSAAQKASLAIERARAQVAALIHANPEEIIFTSGGTEADNFAIQGIAAGSKKKGHIITSATEHHAVLDTVANLEKKGFDVSYLGVDSAGLVDPADVQAAIRDDTILITIMLVNNETGTIQPIEEIAKIARKKGITLHSDAVQGVGKIPVDVNRLGVDLLSIAGHKLYGPRGIGALYVKKGTPLSSILHGGSQENGMRPGTQNTPGIVGFGKACACAMEGIEGNMRYISELKDLMEKTITKEIPDIRIHAQWAERIPHTTSIAFPGIMAMDLVAALDAHKIYASAGAACTSKKMTPSHVLSAMGVSGQDAFETLRLSLGWENKRSGIKRALKQLAIQAKRLKAFGISDKYHLIAFNDMEGLRDAEKILDTNSIEFALIATPAGTAHMNCCSTSIVVKDRSVAASTLGSNGVDIAGIHKISG